MLCVGVFSSHLAQAKDIPLKIMAVSAGPDKSLCQGDTTMLTGSGALIYSWTPTTGLSAANIANPLAFPNFTTMYILFGTDAVGGITRDTVIVTVNVPVPVNAGLDTILCEGQAIVQLFAATPVIVAAYSWYPTTGLNSGVIQNPAAAPDTTTLYSVVVTDLNGCKSFGDRLVTVLPNKTYNIGDTSICAKDTLNLYAGGGISYSWHPGTALLNPTDSTKTTASLIILNDTILQLVIIDSFGCVINQNIQVTANPLPPVNAGIDTIMLCRDSVLLIATSIPGVTYTWSPGNVIDNPFSPVTWGRPWYTGDLTVMVVDDVTGCRNFDSRHVFLSDHFLNVNISSRDTVLCPGFSLPLSANTTHPVIAYGWESLTGNFDNIATQNTVFTPWGDGAVRIVVKDSLECKDAAEITVYLDRFWVQTIPDTTICFGTTLIMGTNGGAIFHWSPISGIDNPNSPAPIANPSLTTTYYVETIDALGCYSYDTTTISVNPRPVANAGNDRELCMGDSLQLQAYGGDSYDWSPATGLSNAFISNPKASPIVATSYVITAYNQFGCTDQDLIRIEVRPVPVIVYGTDASICQEDTVSLFVTGADNYAWSPITGLSNAGTDTLRAFPTKTTIYRVIGTTEYGCTDTGFVTINVTDLPHPTIVGYPGICEGQNILLSVNEGNTFMWNTGETSSAITATPASSMWFTCAAFNGVCGGEIDSFFVEVWQNPIADFSLSQFTQFAPIPVSFTNSSQFANTYTWDFGMEEFPVYEENPIHNFPFAGDFVVTLVAESHKGCKDTVSKPISLVNANLYVPSAFTPNASLDNVNSTFKVGAYGILKLHITIEGRNGNLVYESDDPNFEWDGKIKGQNAPEGVYVYKIVAIAESGKKFEKYGTLTLIR